MRENFGQVLRWLEAIEARLSALLDQTGVFLNRMGTIQDQIPDVRRRLDSLERHMAALLATMPATSERIDKLEARLAALEARSPG